MFILSMFLSKTFFFFSNPPSFSVLPLKHFFFFGFAAALLFMQFLFFLLAYLLSVAQKQSDTRNLTASLHILKQKLNLIFAFSCYLSHLTNLSHLYTGIPKWTLLLISKKFVALNSMKVSTIMNVHLAKLSPAKCWPFASWLRHLLASMVLCNKVSTMNWSRTSTPGGCSMCKGFNSLSTQSVQSSNIKLLSWRSMIRASVDSSEQTKRPARFCCHLKLRETDPTATVSSPLHQGKERQGSMVLPLCGPQA